jgi:hypothetical protein
MNIRADDPLAVAAIEAIHTGDIPSFEPAPERECQSRKG